MAAITFSYIGITQKRFLFIEGTCYVFAHRNRRTGGPPQSSKRRKSWRFGQSPQFVSRKLVSRLPLTSRPRSTSS